MKVCNIYLLFAVKFDLIKEKTQFLKFNSIFKIYYLKLNFAILAKIVFFLIEFCNYEQIVFILSLIFTVSLQLTFRYDTSF